MTNTDPFTGQASGFPGSSSNQQSPGGFGAITSGLTAGGIAPISGVSRKVLNASIYVPRSFGASEIVRMTFNQWLKTLSVAQMESFVPELQRAGFLGQNPGAGGVFDPITIMQGLARAVELASVSDTPLHDLIRQAGDAGQATAEAGGTTKFVQGGNTSVGLTSPDAVRVIGNEVAQKLVGRRLKDDEVADVLRTVQGSQLSEGAVQVQSAQANQSAYAQAMAGGAIGSGNNASLDSFMRAIAGKESGGNPNAVNADSGAAGTFQIMPSNWPSWSREAGLPSGAPMTPENQNIVAAFKMQQYFHQFGNWGAVAVAWYGGPGAAAKWVENPSAPAFSAPQTSGGHSYPSINQYVSDVLGRLSQAGYQTGGAQQAQPSAPAPTAGAPGAYTVGQGSSFRVPTGTVNLLPPRETIYQKPDDVSVATSAYLMRNHADEYQANNLLGVFGVIDQLMRQGDQSKAAQPAQTGGQV